MRILLFISLFIIFCEGVKSQNNETLNNRTTQLEALAEKNDSEPVDDSYELDLDYFSRHPLNLNTADEEDLIQLHILEVLQVKNFISYRKLLGLLVSIYELQAIPGWDIGTIRQLLPYIKIGRDESLYSSLKERWKGGDEAVLMRAAQVIEKAKGFMKPNEPGNSYYEGSAQKIFLRYTYNYKQLLA
ncbi:MAG TPA: helix-hairpin-helix domain-containing protein, partial [Puia sp.]|nr:helix-hairpin-helix domain-containing protein [Puia sp.]